MTTTPDSRPRLRSGLSPWARASAALLTLAILGLSLPRLGRALWSAFSTWLATGEVEATLPARMETVETLTSDEHPSVTIVYSLGGHADLVLQLARGDDAHLQLTLARTLTALTILCLVALVATLGARVALNRSVYRMLVRGSTVCGVILLVGPLVASILEANALRSIAARLRAERGVTTIFPEDVELVINQLALVGGLALLVLALVLRAAERDAEDLRDLV
ncbi:hypothetical protein IGS67_07085 [Flavimobilis sp. GY10621]|uniref:DUF2975 domain-containing protein n=1 Tax=Flavimobilis rhizosphaerae TaxID=2775421 RepID=A0ABR9DQJ0_9MICO|nr:hypothetical protein [Flavimobilis rhizosphaerae]MBD9699253.1 hypothetical protein [Flavimobilis rhizosphaerae]